MLKCGSDIIYIKAMRYFQFQPINIKQSLVTSRMANKNERLAKPTNFKSQKAPGISAMNLSYVMIIFSFPICGINPNVRFYNAW